MNCTLRRLDGDLSVCIAHFNFHASVCWCAPNKLFFLTRSAKKYEYLEHYEISRQVFFLFISAHPFDEDIFVTHMVVPFVQQYRLIQTRVKAELCTPALSRMLLL